MKWLVTLTEWLQTQLGMSRERRLVMFESIKLIKKGIEKSRLYASFFEWHDRDREEKGVVESLQESLQKNQQEFFENIRSRGRGNDPPDCEADLISGGQVAIEVTELVSGEAIRCAKHGYLVHAVYTESDLIKRVNDGLVTKGGKRSNLKGGPYKQYVVVIYTNEHQISFEWASTVFSDQKFCCPNIDKAFLLISYYPCLKMYPYVELKLESH